MDCILDVNGQVCARTRTSEGLGIVALQAKDEARVPLECDKKLEWGRRPTPNSEGTFDDHISIRFTCAICLGCYFALTPLKFANTAIKLTIQCKIHRSFNNLEKV
jgi:hypothetical protein